MARLGLMVLFLATTSIAQATADVQLVPMDGSGSLLATSGGPFTGGESLTIAVLVSEPSSQTSFVRLAQFDFSNTNSALDVSNFQKFIGTRVDCDRSFRVIAGHRQIKRYECAFTESTTVNTILQMHVERRGKIAV